MNVTIEIPSKEIIFSNGIKMKVAKKPGEKWSESDLGKYANKSGVYLFYSDKKILYIGKTTGKRTYSGGKINWGIFSKRLRRHLQKRASGNSYVHQSLAKVATPLFCYFIDLDSMNKIFKGEKQFTDISKALILEQALIGTYESSKLINK